MNTDKRIIYVGLIALLLFSVTLLFALSISQKYNNDGLEHKLELHQEITDTMQKQNELLELRLKYLAEINALSDEE